MLAPVPRPEAASRAVWTFSPRPRPRTSRDDANGLRLGIEAALRAGHGAEARFRLCVVGGAESSVLLSVDDGPSERWAERALFRSYEHGDWRRAPAPVASPRQLWFAGRRRGLPGESPEAPVEPGRVLRALAAAARVGGEGTSVVLAFRPAPGPRFRLLDQWLRWEPTALRADRPARPQGRSPASPGREAPPLTPPLVWSLAISVAVAPSSLPGGPSGVLAAVRSAWTALDGRPLGLARAATGPVESFRSWISGTELPGFLPASEHEPHVAHPGPSPGGGIPLGRAASGSLVSLPVEAEQGRHFAVLGETGMGKSSLLVALARRAARRGGVVLLDPLGETAETLRLELRADGLEPLWIAPGTAGIGVNALAGIRAALRTDPVRGERELGDLVHALRRVRAGRYVDSAYWGPRLEEMLVRAVRAAASVPGGTLEDAHALLAGAGVGRSVVPPELSETVRELASRVRDRPEDAEGARRLLYEIVRNPTLSALLCARQPGLALSELVEPGTVALVSGAAARVGESTARYLLAAYLALVWSELLSRPSRAKTFVLLDEAQWFAHEALGEMLRLARRLNVHVGITTQSLATLPEEVREAVRTNVADLVVFRGSPEEAQAVGRTTSGVSAESLLGLSRGEAAVLIGKGETVRWVRTARLPEAGPSDDTPSSPGRGPVAEPPGPEIASADGAGGASATGQRSEAAGDDPFLEEIRTEAGRLAPGELLKVDLASVRDRGLADERRLRAWGGELGRRGAIVRSERGAAGPVWWLDPTSLVSGTEGQAVRSVSCRQKHL